MGEVALYVELFERTATDQVMADLKTLFTGYPGGSPVFVTLGYKTLRLPEQFNVEVTKDLQRKVDALLRPWSARDDPDGWVYAVEGTDRLVKIGWSKNPAQRIRNLQTAHGSPLRLIGVGRGGKEREAELHERFGYARQHGEWFRLGVKEIEWLKATLPEGNPPGDSGAPNGGKAQTEHRCTAEYLEEGGEWKERCHLWKGHEPVRMHQINGRNWW